jgi:hypothetical protein
MRDFAADGLAGARFSDKAQHLAGGDVEGDVLDGGDEPLVGAEADIEVADGDQAHLLAVP